MRCFSDNHSRLKDLKYHKETQQLLHIASMNQDKKPFFYILVDYNILLDLSSFLKIYKFAQISSDFLNILYVEIFYLKNTLSKLCILTLTLSR